MSPIRRLWRCWLIAALTTPVHSALVSRSVNLPASVQILNAADEDQQIALEIGLRLQNIDLLEEKLRAVSDPESPDYGNYLSADEVLDIFTPTDKSRTAVEEWLEAHGITDHVDKGMYINFVTTVSKANTLLNASFSFFDVKGVTKLRTTQYSIPEELGEHIELVSPTTYFGTTKPLAPIIQPPPDTISIAQVDEEPKHNCARLITPPCMAEMYNVTDYEPDPDSGSRVGFASFLNQSAVPGDLDIFLDMFGLPHVKWDSVEVNGGIDHQNPDEGGGSGVLEGNLDAQWMAAVSGTLPMTHYITGGSPPMVPNIRMNHSTNTNEPYLEFYQHLLLELENDEIPQVLSTSYADDEQTVPREYAVRVCNLMGMMGLRGMTILHSSGDAGVGAPCLSNDGLGTAEFTPQFPPTCPYVTAVGGTQAYGPEIAWSGSGGGFSQYFDRPWYQEDAVERYLGEVIPPEVKEYFEPFVAFGGRGFPDLAAHSLSPPYQVIIRGATQFSGGTSAASPVVAGIIGLLNDARLRAGLPVMGFLNPWLYGKGHSAFIDVTSGRTRGCYGTDSQSGLPVPGGGIIEWAGWNGTEGWDPTTGFGVPDFRRMLEVVLEGAETKPPETCG